MSVRAENREYATGCRRAGGRCVGAFNVINNMPPPFRAVGGMMLMLTKFIIIRPATDSVVRRAADVSPKNGTSPFPTGTAAALSRYFRFFLRFFFRRLTGSLNGGLSNVLPSPVTRGSFAFVSTSISRPESRFRAAAYSGSAATL